METADGVSCSSPAISENEYPSRQCMLKGNLPAARFYESMGGKNFPEQNRNKEYSGHDISEVIYIFAREL